ncbi:MAG: hypothetical protein K8I04_06085 [Gammaproteobacteria bacterium]|nr:hypothetical protein [Gammaproteobacteria bacterium]
MMRNYSVLFAVAIGILAFNVQAKELYVNGATGNDSVSYSNNSAASPWRTLGRAMWGSTSIASQNASEAARAGDNVNVAAGTYGTSAATNSRLNPIYNPTNNGTANAPITIRANGDVYLTASTGAQPIIGALSRSYIVWDGFILNETSISTTADTGPVTVWDSHHITIKNARIIGRVINWNDNHVGIRVERASNIILANNVISGFTDTGMNAACIMTYDVANSIFEHNECFNAITGIFIKGDHPGDNLPQHGITLRNNYIHNVSNAIQFGGIGSAANLSMSYVYRNLIVDATFGGVIFIGYDSVSPAKVTVANNTFHRVGLSGGNEGAAILLRPGYNGYRDLTFRNNLVTNSSAGVAAWDTAFNANISATTFSHNNYYSNTAGAYIAYRTYSLSGWQSTFNKDTVATSALNPQYVSSTDFRLSSGSPLRSMGIDILDLNGNGSTSDAIPIGAYVTGNEVIGPTSTVTNAFAAPSPPTDIEIVR